MKRFRIFDSSSGRNITTVPEADVRATERQRQRALAQADYAAECEAAEAEKRAKFEAWKVEMDALNAARARGEHLVVSVPSPPGQKRPAWFPKRPLW